MSILSKLRNMLAAAPAADTDNAFDNSRRLIDAVVGHLRPLAGAGGSSELHFWLDDGADPTLPLLIDGESFRSAMCQELYEQRLEQFAVQPFVLHTDAQPEGLRLLYRVVNGVSMSVGPVPKVVHEPKTTMQTARLSLVEGTGHALQPDLELVPGTDKKRWCIGRGREHLSSVSLRRNDYVVNDGEPEADGGAVSRAHCDIHYRNGAFYLQACPGGCRQEGGAATKVLPAGSDRIIELHSSTLQRQLTPGDIITLGNTVQLRFDRQKPNG